MKKMARNQLGPDIHRTRGFASIHHLVLSGESGLGGRPLAVEPTSLGRLAAEISIEARGWRSPFSTLIASSGLGHRS